MGLGCWGIGGAFKHLQGMTSAYGHVKDEDSIRAIQKGIDMGVTLFDTANAYGCGRSERVLGKIIKDYRDDIVLATKFGRVWNFEYPDSSIPCQIVGDDVSPDSIRQACEDSLKRLQTDYIDIYQLHLGNMSVEEVPNVLSTLDSLVEDGLIRSYGWSSDDPKRVELFARKDHCSVTQFHLSISAVNPLMIKVLEDNNIGGLIKSPLNNGILTGKYKNDSKRPLDHMMSNSQFDQGRIKIIRLKLDKLKEILLDDGRTLAQASIAWIWSLSDKVIPIPGFRTIEQVEENAKVLEIGPLKQSQIQEINSLFKDVQVDESQSL